MKCRVLDCSKDRTIGLLVCADHIGTPPPWKDETEPETVNHPAHYNVGKIEVIEFIEDQRLDHHCGTAVKYICRAGRKDPEKHGEDLRKAIWYLRRRLELLKDNPRRPNEMPNPED